MVLANPTHVQNDTVCRQPGGVLFGWLHLIKYTHMQKERWRNSAQTLRQCFNIVQKNFVAIDVHCILCILWITMFITHYYITKSMLLMQHTRSHNNTCTHLHTHKHTHTHIHTHKHTHGLPTAASTAFATKGGECVWLTWLRHTRTIRTHTRTHTHMKGSPAAAGTPIAIGGACVWLTWLTHTHNILKHSLLLSKLLEKS